MTEEEKLLFKQAKAYLYYVNDLSKFATLTGEETRLRAKATTICRDLLPKVRLHLQTPPTDLFDV